MWDFLGDVVTTAWVIALIVWCNKLEKRVTELENCIDELVDVEVEDEGEMP